MRVKRKDTPAGFTLVELLAACAIMVIIALIVVQFFHKATLLWDVGTRRSDAVMRGRAIVNAIVQDLQMAITTPSDMTNDAPFEVGSSSAAFWMLGNPADGKPAMRYVEIKFDGGKITRTVLRYYPNTPGESADLADEVEALQFTPEVFDDLPASVTVSVRSSTNYPPFQATARLISRDFGRL